MILTNILDVYNAEDNRVQAYAESWAEAHNSQPDDFHTGRLFFHITCTGRSKSYDSAYINSILCKDETPEQAHDRHYIKEGIVFRLSQLSEEQCQWLTEGLSAEAWEHIQRIDSKLQRFNAEGAYSEGQEYVSILADIESAVAERLSGKTSG